MAAHSKISAQPMQLISRVASGKDVNKVPGRKPFEAQVGWGGG